MSCLSLQTGNLRSAVETLVQNSVSKINVAKRVQLYMKAIFPHVQSLLQKSLSNNETDVILTLTKVLDPINSSDQRKAHIWTHKSLDGMHLIYAPESMNLNPREDGLEEMQATEVFMAASEVSLAVQKLKVFSYKEDILAAELNSLSLLSKIPGIERYLVPKSFTYQGFARQAPGHENFHEGLNFIHALSAAEFLDVYQDVLEGLKLFESAGYVSLDMRSEGIVFKREGKSIRGLIDRSLNTSCVGSKISLPKIKRLNHLANEGHIFFATHGYALTLSISEAFFLDLDRGLPEDQSQCEVHALERLKSILYNDHYEKVLELKALHKGFGVKFSQDLLHYITKIAREGEGGFQRALLEQFAFKMTVFPEVSNLFLRALAANKLHKKLLDAKESLETIFARDPKIPSLHEIENVIQAGRLKLRQIHLVKELSYITEVSDDVVKGILQKLHCSGYGYLFDSLKRVLNDTLQEFPHVGSEVRIHKVTNWCAAWEGASKVPFSFWINVQMDKLVLEFFDLYENVDAGVGGNKKTKIGMQIEVSSEGSLTSAPIVIARIRRGALDWVRMAKGEKIQEEILSIPGAKEFFLGLSRKHAPEQVNGKYKLEAVAPRFPATLYDVLKEDLLKIEEGQIHLSTLEYISLLQDIGSGLAILQNAGISHGDMKDDNIAIFFENGKVRARIFDFDWGRKFNCYYNKSTSYVFWNKLRQEHGFISAETDVYGYVLIIAEMLLKDFKVRNHSECVLRLQRIAENPEEEKRKLQRENKTLEVYPEMDSPEAADQQRLATESLIFDRVFDLLVKTLQADQRSGKLMTENLANGLEKPAAAKKAMLEAGFPLLSEIAEVLEFCVKMAEEVDYQCKVQQLHQFLAIEPIAT